ncbi:T-complex-associated testis-expressed protein 1-like [Arapaima gigas]
MSDLNESEVEPPSEAVVEPCPEGAQVGQATEHRQLRRIIAEDTNWTLVLIPLLRDLCLQNIVKNFEDKPILNELLPTHKALVLEKLSPNLPLHITANLITDDNYWKRCCVERWGLSDVSTYGNSWKRMFFERHLENIIELFIPDVTNPQSVINLVPLCKNYVKRLRITQLLPPVKDIQRPEEADGSGSTREIRYDGPSIDHFDFGILLSKLTQLEELHVVYGVKGCGMNFEWNLFEFTHRDCQALAEALKSCKTLKVFKIHQSKVDDDKCRTLVSKLLHHPSLKDLSLAHNMIGDRGARAIGKLLNSSKLEKLNICDNKIQGPGARAIAHALSTNTMLVSLNLRLNQLGDDGGQAIAQALLTNETLENLHLGANEMTEPTATALSQVLVQNKTLKNINLSCNRLGVDGGEVLEEGMCHNTTLLECDIRLTEVSQECEYCLSKILQKNQNRARKKRLQEAHNK